MPGGGDEVVFGGGKVIRESMGQAGATRAEGTPDLVITGAVVLDHWGIVKADVGVRDGRIVGLGKAGNPDVMDGVDPGLVIGPSTEVLAGNGQILTAGAIDCHVHLICRAGDRGAGLRRHDADRRRHRTGRGTKATTVTPGAWNLARMLEALDACRERRVARQGQHVGGSAREQLEGGARVQAARGLGLDAGRHRRVPAGGRRVGRAGRAAHRHAQRGRLRGGHHRRDRRAGDSRLPHRGRRRRPRAGHHHGRRRWPTCCRRRRTRPARTPSTRSTSTSTC